MNYSWSPTLVDMAAAAAEKSKARLSAYLDHPELIDRAPAIQIYRLLTGEQTLSNGFPFACLPHHQIHHLLAKDLEKLFDPIDKLLIETQVELHRAKKELLQLQKETSSAYEKAVKRVCRASEISWLIANNPYTRDLLIKNGFDPGFFAVGGYPQNYIQALRSASYVTALQVAAGEIVTMVFRREIYEQIRLTIPGEKWEIVDPYDDKNYWKKYRRF